MLKTTVAYLPRNSQHHRYISNAPVVQRRRLQPTGVKIARLCEYDRRLLARRHPGTMGATPTDADHWLAEPGAYRRIAAWRDREHWLAVVVAMALNARPEALTRHHVSRDTFRTWARTESLRADIGTGRRIIVRPDVIAADMECATRTVQRCRAAARDLGLMVDVQAGRMLTHAEAMAARQQGSPQRGLANESAMTVPAWLGITPWRTSQFGNHVTPPSGPSPRDKKQPTSPPRRAKGTTRLTARLKKDAKAPAAEVIRARQTARQVATELIGQIEFLFGEQPGRLIPTLTRFATGPLAWTAHDIGTHIKRTDTLRGRTPLRRHEINTRPAAVLAAYLRDLDPQADHPRFDPDNGFTNPASTTWPEWCGHCDPHTRQTELTDGRMARCSTCHPLSGQQ